MTYNIHPLFVHFPIAFLFLYSILTIIPFYKWFPSFSWKEVRFVVLVVGVIGAIFASITGEVAEHLVRPDKNLVEMHSFFAGFSIFIYSLILVGQLFSLINPYIEKKFINFSLLKLFRFIERILSNKIVSILLSIIGLVSISFTGLLGGVMVYGTSTDPIAPIVLKLLGI